MLAIFGRQWKELNENRDWRTRDELQGDGVSQLARRFIVWQSSIPIFVLLAAAAGPGQMLNSEWAKRVSPHC